MKHMKLTHKFVELIPTEMDEGVLYVSMEYATAIHKCACGCGREVVTAISPTDWSFLFDGDSVTLDPSIGNWNFPCRSHYFIRRSQIRWAGEMSQHAIDRGRKRDRANKDAYFESEKTDDLGKSETPIQRAPEPPILAAALTQQPSAWQKIIGWLTK